MSTQSSKTNQPSAPEQKGIDFSKISTKSSQSDMEIVQQDFWSAVPKSNLVSLSTLQSQIIQIEEIDENQNGKFGPCWELKVTFPTKPGDYAFVNVGKQSITYDEKTRQPVIGQRDQFLTIAKGFLERGQRLPLMYVKGYPTEMGNDFLMFIQPDEYQTTALANPKPTGAPQLTTGVDGVDEAEDLPF